MKSSGEENGGCPRQLDGHKGMAGKGINEHVRDKCDLFCPAGNQPNTTDQCVSILSLSSRENLRMTRAGWFCAGLRVEQGFQAGQGLGAGGGAPAGRLLLRGQRRLSSSLALTLMKSGDDDDVSPGGVEPELAAGGAEPSAGGPPPASHQRLCLLALSVSSFSSLFSSSCT